ncbi:MAG: hypothetical protein ACK4N6_06390, partial [Rhodocyclaceae bacterium]
MRFDAAQKNVIIRDLRRVKAPVFYTGRDNLQGGLQILLKRRQLRFPPGRSDGPSSGEMKTGAFMSKSYLFTSESVSEGHPDKVADQ